MVWINNGTRELDELSQYKTILGVCITLSILTTTIVLLRGYTRIKILKFLGIDDYIIFFTCVSDIGPFYENNELTHVVDMCSHIQRSLHRPVEMGSWTQPCAAAGRQPERLFHCTQRIRPTKASYSLCPPQINFVGRPFYMFGILGFKVALCFAFLRIMKTSSHTIYRGITWFVMISCIVGHVAGTFILIFQCKPTRKSWLPRTPGSCLPNDDTFYTSAAVTILFDVIIFCLPIPLLVHLNISKKKKFALVCVFLLGLLTTVCSIMRMIQIITIARTGNSTMLVLWGVIELNIGVSPHSPLISHSLPSPLPPNGKSSS